MSKSILIVERDVPLMKSIAAALIEKGFAASESTDGKNAAENVRKERPDLIVLAVDLEAGQNGYIICKKLKSDDDLKSIPVIIIGDSKGFGQHQKLKTRAEDYIGKPFETSTVIERVGALLGFPEVENIEELIDDPAEEIEIESVPGEIPLSSDSALVDSVFNDPIGDDIDIDEIPEKTMIGMAPFSGKPEEKSSSIRAFASTPSSMSLDERRNVPLASDDRRADDRQLRAKVTELTGSLDDARNQVSDLENRVRDLEAEVENKSNELESAKSTASKSDSKDLFALKDAATKKDKEILRLKNELNAKETEILELKEKENSLEQQSSDATGELARRDAQLKSLTAKVEQLQVERKKVDQQLTQAREEGRSSAASLSALQSDFDAIQSSVSELDELRNRLQDAESSQQRAESELAESRGEIEAIKSQLDDRQLEADETRSQLEQAQIDLDGARNQVTTQATTFADEMSSLRQKIADAEESASKHSERVVRTQSRLKAQQAQLDSLKDTLRSALDSVSENSEDIELEELADA